MFNGFRLPWITLVVSAMVTACGGGGLDPQVNQIKAQSLQYGKSATISIAGKYMRNDMIADTGTCTLPSFSSSSVPDLAVLNCTVTTVGPLPITIKNADGSTLFSTSLTVLPPQVTLFTSAGTVVMELDANVVPATVNNFLSYVNTGFYQSTLFHRVIAGFVVQGGGYTKGLVKQLGQKAAIALESNKGLSNTRGTVAMARTGVFDSATSEFYVNLAENLTLDYQSAASPGYAVFGKVVKGMEVIDAIAAVPTGSTDVPIADVTLTLALQTQ